MMTVRPFLAQFVAFGAIASMAAVPAMADAQSLRDLERLVDRRQSKKNEWRNIAIGAGALGVLGLLKKDNTLFFAGTAGALYSLHRYEQDRKSQSKLARARASYFNKSYFYRDGKRYNRKTVYKGGKKYYRFVRA
ncbi:MAG: hypothetical protein ACO1SV_03820 [Fimbriimonas sp.]